VKRIGGKGAETLLAEILNTTGRGTELVWLTRALQEMAPNRYRESALESARELLAQPAPTGAPGPLDRFNRDSLFETLIFFGDSSYVSAAQEQVVTANGQVDRSALKYLQETLGPQALPLVAQWYDDPRIKDPSEKELLARMALDYVGVDPQADPIITKAIYDPTLPDSNRKNLITGLKEGPDEVIKNRIEFVEGLLTSDPVNSELRETHTDLVKKAAGTNP